MTVVESRGDKPIAHVETRVVREDGTVVLEGTAVTYTLDLGRFEPRLGGHDEP